MEKFSYVKVLNNRKMWIPGDESHILVTPARIKKKKSKMHFEQRREENRRHKQEVHQIGGGK